MSRVVSVVLASVLAASAFPSGGEKWTTREVRALRDVNLDGLQPRKVDVPVFEPQFLAGNDSDFDVLEHLAGISPYFNAPGVQLQAAPPAQCTVSRATYLIRHSNIYANDFDYESIIEPFTSKLANFTAKTAFANQTAQPNLAFLSSWTSPITNASAQVEALTPSGADSAKALGQVLAGLYKGLLPNSTSSVVPNGAGPIVANGTSSSGNSSSSTSGQGPYRVWTSDSERTIASANAFIQGLYPTSPNSSASLQVVPEGEDESANTLTPHESCSNFHGSTGSDQSSAWRSVYTAPIIQRFNAAVPGFNFTAIDIFAMQELCGYETVIRGSSPFCQAFEQDDWLGFEYTNDLMYFYSLGYGSPVAPYLGVPWVNASTTLLAPDVLTIPSTSANGSSVNQSSINQSVYFSFTHREEPPFVLTALGLFNNSAYDGGVDDVNGTMPTDRINYNRAWKTSEILPFLGHVGLERIECSAPATSGAPGASNGTAPPSSNGTSATGSSSYVRALVNAAPIPFPNCQSGPGSSCPLSDFIAFSQALSATSASSQPSAPSSSNSSSSSSGASDTVTNVTPFGDFVGACNVNTTRVTNATNVLGIYWNEGPGAQGGVNNVTTPRVTRHGAAGRRAVVPGVALFRTLFH